MKNYLLKGLVLLGAFLCYSMTQAQSVSGVVSDPSGPLPGANVLVKGTTNGTQTDFDGNYTLENVDANAVLVFSYVGFVTQEVPVNGRSEISITLQIDSQSLEEVVVIGYGTQAVKDATGAVAVVSSDDFNQGVISSPEQLIQGKTAGVQISQSSGEPGAGINIRIRGTASVRSNNNPLFVVDGMPLAGDDTQGGGSDLGVGATNTRNPLNFLNPNDIESMSILKDASATAIYGSRGANGVVIITTKSGRAGAGGVWNFDSSIAHSTPSKTFDLLNREQYLQAIAQYGNNPSDRDFGYDTDWQNVVLRNTLSPISNLSYSNNYGNGYVRASLGYQKQFGIIQNSSQERLTGRLNASHRFFDERLKLNLNATLSRVNDEAPLVTNTAGSQGDLLGSAYFANPTYPNNPSFDPGGGELNPANLMQTYEDVSRTNRTLLNFSAEYEIVKGLSAKINLGYDNSESKRNQLLDPKVIGLNNGTVGNGRGAYRRLDATTKLMDITVNYKKEFSNSTFEALLGYSYQEFHRKGIDVLGWGYSTSDHGQMMDDLKNSANILESAIDGSYQQYVLDAGGLEINRLFPDIVTESMAVPRGISVTTVGGDKYDYTDELQSYFGRLNYTIADKYLFTATLRVDGSSRFGPDNQYGWFPSGAFAWKINEEDFIGDNVSTLKLRLGYGITGNQDGLGYGNFTRRQRYAGIAIGNDGLIATPGLETVSLAQPDLKWEETSQANIGFDFGFNQDRLNGSIDVYYKKTKDLLLKSEVAQPSPQPFSFQNVDGKVINKGIEFAINYDIIQQEDIFWNIGFNIAYNDNMVKDLTGQIQTGDINGNGLTGAYAQLLATDQPLFSFYLREFGGFDENGISIYPNGDIQQFVGASALPDITSGLSTSFGYKNWTLNAFFAGQFGQYVYNNTANAFFTAGIINGGKNVTTDVLTNGESPANAPDVSTRFLEKADFVRLQNASITYDVPLSGEGTFKNLRLSLIGQNLFVITDYSGLDPEVNVPVPLNDIPSLGVDYSSFPRPRTISFGLNATF
ncbi:SusC/RagA family TonB-linked outer membrane protein [Robertkochia solimangrovi]|uniref:SusC/RagA family TonB-linked outer membrane protein n=1 Tax=Robertkochia solimangrovi TaxID=2213046 RepID=UPI00117C6C16|nr:TonB-dependent receptor [Robertkochia solimangrovi]TRZ43303.1 SusC/RagA family TonB-linked outer membrane protein [Robertkochia solimangrovi]